jgi:hypothetical protein
MALCLALPLLYIQVVSGVGARRPLAPVARAGVRAVAAAGGGMREGERARGDSNTRLKLRRLLSCPS